MNERQVPGAALYGVVHPVRSLRRCGTRRYLCGIVTNNSTISNDGDVIVRVEHVVTEHNGTLVERCIIQRWRGASFRSAGLAVALL